MPKPYIDFTMRCDILSKKLIGRGCKKDQIYVSISTTFGGNREDLLTHDKPIEPKV